MNNSLPHGALAIVVCSIFLGRFVGRTVFTLKEPSKPIKPTSVSMNTGGSEDADLRLAEYLTKELKERTTLQVIGQEEVSKAIPSYPITVKSVEEKNGEVAWVDPSEKARIEKIQARLKTNYVFVIWSKRMMKHTV